jgi:hypothetical protein
MTTILQFKALLYLNYAHKNQNNFNDIFVPVQLNERIPFSCKAMAWLKT